jgi:hypothetical protein
MPCCKRLVFIATAVLTGCGAHGVPLAVSDCAVAIHSGISRVQARVINNSDKPMESADVRVDLYQNYRFRRAIITAEFRPVLDPGDSRRIAIDADLMGVLSGTAMSCTAIRAVYGDGTVQTENGN